MKHHFEQLWVAAEALTSKYSDISLENRVEIIVEQAALLKTDNDIQTNSDVFGRILLQLCGISRELNINSYTSLVDSMQQAQIAEMDDEEP